MALAASSSFSLIRSSQNLRKGISLLSFLHRYNNDHGLHHAKTYLRPCRHFLIAPTSGINIPKQRLILHATCSSSLHLFNTLPTMTEELEHTDKKPRTEEKDKYILYCTLTTFVAQLWGGSTPSIRRLAGNTWTWRTHPSGFRTCEPHHRPVDVLNFWIAFRKGRCRLRGCRIHSRCRRDHEADASSPGVCSSHATARRYHHVTNAEYHAVPRPAT